MTGSHQCFMIGQSKVATLEIERHFHATLAQCSSLLLRTRRLLRIKALRVVIDQPTIERALPMLRFGALAAYA
jgi:hypothetical protein